ncbi:C-C motif chemokine 18-like [Podarcis raffonei]|uniref:C-C motif chemokine 18-like n=1 Tax=Podarcis raffonei TaxID=65483 RepID=UPI00232971A0|nr:C-C motif chemokine 18-like [Podarcis raffonei]
MKLSLTSFGFLFLGATFALASVCPCDSALSSIPYFENSSSSRAYCCLNYINKAIPCKAIKYYEWASSKCPKPAVIVHLKKNNKKLCADPSKEWVQKILKCFPPPS